MHVTYSKFLIQQMRFFLFSCSKSRVSGGVAGRLLTLIDRRRRTLRPQEIFTRVRFSFVHIFDAKLS